MVHNWLDFRCNFYTVVAGNGNYIYFLGTHHCDLSVGQFLSEFGELRDELALHGRWSYAGTKTALVIGPIPWGHSGPLCHALSLSMLSWTSMRRRRATVATPGEWQSKTGGVRRLAVVNGPNIFQMLLESYW